MFNFIKTKITSGPLKGSKVNKKYYNKFEFTYNSLNGIRNYLCSHLPPDWSDVEFHISGTHISGGTMAQLCALELGNYGKAVLCMTSNLLKMSKEIIFDDKYTIPDNIVIVNLYDVEINNRNVIRNYVFVIICLLLIKI